MDASCAIQDGQLALFMVGADVVARVSAAADVFCPAPLRYSIIGLFPVDFRRTVRFAQELGQIVSAGRAKEVVDLNLTGNNLK